jgi:hypothetical protein
MHPNPRLKCETWGHPKGVGWERKGFLDWGSISPTLHAMKLREGWGTRCSCLGEIRETWDTGAKKRRGGHPFGSPPLLSEVFEDPESAPDYIYLSRRVNREAASMTRSFPATFAVAFDVRASLNCLPFAVARLRLCDRFSDRRALLPGP